MTASATDTEATAAWEEVNGGVQTTQEEEKESESCVQRQPQPNKLPVDRDWLQKLLRRHNPTFPRDQRINAYVLAPMVDQSDLPFRLQCRKYGTNLCFTPMIHAKLFATSPNFRKKFIPILLEQDRPLVAQLCGSDLEYMEYTAKAVAPYCDAIDINCGCPQNIAKRGKYGAFLLENETLLLSTVRHLLKVLDKPLTVKVRLLPAHERDASVEASLDLYAQLVDAGIHMLTVHGRTRHHKGADTGHADWDAIRTVVERFGHRIPVLANGSIADQADVRNCLRVTGVDGVMSSEAILEYPPLFRGMMEADAAGDTATTVTEPERRVGRLELAQEYLELATQHPPNRNGQGSGIKCMRVHIHRFLHADLQIHTDIRQDVVNSQTVDDLKRACDRLRERRLQDLHYDVRKEQLSWYMRHRDNQKAQQKKKQQQAAQMAHEKELRNDKNMEVCDDSAYCSTTLFGEY